MGRVFARALLLVLIASAAACTSVGTMSKQLDVGMPELQVRTLLGEPYSIELSTCGSNTGNPWQCKQFNYYDSSASLMIVYFSQSSSGTWVVNNWSVF